MTSLPLDQAVEIAADLDLERLPDHVLQHAERTIADTVAVSRAGAREPEMARLGRLLAAQGSLRTPVGADASAPASGGPGAATTFLEDRLVGPPADVAFVNATAGTFLELDEGVRPTGHPAMHVVPAALAVAESVHATGSELLRAVLAGYEVTARLFTSVRLTYPVHPHGHFGAIGAAVAAAMLSGGDPVGAARVAATTPLLPVWDACFDGATARNTFTGHAARTGVMATYLDKAGFTGSPSSLATAYGRIAGELVDPDQLSRPLDYTALGITRNYFKRHSACALSHAAIDAVAQLALPDGAEIEQVHVETVNNNMKLARQPQANDLSGRFSLPYAVATALARKSTGPADFRYSGEIAQLAQRVTVSVAPDLEAQWPDAAPARVRVESNAGTFSATVRNPRGHWSDPLTPEEIQAKFTALLDNPDVSPSWWGRITEIRSLPDCADLFAPARA
ncbi:MAG: 2-methylcitrate dehydratase PrpD [Frankiales bacterium]|nr:2-methylcitrate dehydratase PrpD [Frankiales bacterium]